MFEETIRALRQLERRTQVSVPISDDEEGYLDQECSSDECQFQFKVQGEGWSFARFADIEPTPTNGGRKSSSHMRGKQRWRRLRQVLAVRFGATANAGTADNRVTASSP